MNDENSIKEEIVESKYKSCPKVYLDVPANGKNFEFLLYNNEKYLRTTSILQYWTPPKLLSYFKKNSENAQTKTLHSAGRIGSALHKVAEGVHFDPNSLNPAETKLFENAKASFAKFKSEVAYKPLAYEVTLVSNDLKTAGTIDLICEYKGKLCIFDWKTSNYVGSNARWQLSAYKYLFEENFGEKIDCVAVKLSKNDASYFPIEYRNYDMSLRGYLGLLSAFQDENYKELMECWPNGWNKDVSGFKHRF